MHTLLGIQTGGAEEYLGQYEDFYHAIEAAEKIEFSEYNAFKVTKDKNCIIGTRISGDGGHDIFWRIPRECKRGRDRRFWEPFIKLIKSKL